MEAIIRSAVKTDFDKVYPLFKQLWPNKELNCSELKKVFERGVESDTDALFTKSWGLKNVPICFLTRCNCSRRILFEVIRKKSYCNLFWSGI